LILIFAGSALSHPGWISGSAISVPVPCFSQLILFGLQSCLVRDMLKGTSLSP